MKDKGFTLIELLAVIIILGILMLIAIPSVTSYINNSRKESYVTTLNELIKGATIKVNSGDIEVNDPNTTYYIPVSAIELESGNPKSPYGEFDEAYVVVTYDGDNYDYYFLGKDNTDMGTKKVTPASIIDKDDIVPDVSDDDVTPKYSIDGRPTIIEFTSDGKDKKPTTTPTDYIDTNGDLYKAPFKLGDYVTVVPDSSSYTITNESTGWYLDQTITPNELTLWRVINKKEDGTTELISEYLSSGYVRFGGVQGYKHFIKILLDVAAQYSKAGYTIATRMYGYDGQTLVLEDTSLLEGTHESPPQSYDTPTITSGTGQEYRGGVLGDTLYIKDYLLLKGVYSNLHAYRVSNKSSYEHYWIASRCYDYSTNPTEASYGGRIYSHSPDLHLGCSGFQFCYNNSECFSNSNASTVRPIITLKSNLMIAGGDGTKDNPYTLR